MEDKYSCLIVDDEPLARRLLTNYVAKIDQLDLVGTLKSALEISEVLKEQKVDLLFLDIRMPGLSGVSFVEKSEELPAVIFTTAYEEYAVKAFELDIVDYLVKPFSLERFKKAVDRFTEYAELMKEATPEDKQLVVKANHGFLRIPHEDILYVEAMGEYMKLQLSDKPSELIYMRMKELEVLLGDGFIRIHKSYLVNQHKIDRLKGDFLVVGERKLKMSRLYKSSVVAALKSLN